MRIARCDGRLAPGLVGPSISGVAAGVDGRQRTGQAPAAVTPPNSLGGAEQRVLHLADENHQIGGACSIVAEEIGIQTGMTKIEQQSHLLRRETEQMLFAVMGDFHRNVRFDCSA